jgi:predicted ABC-type transport system involved in lysophospholipase L1 biosynthesis ATPase subunit
MGQISERIEKILLWRGERLPRVRAELARWREVSTGIAWLLEEDAVPDERFTALAAEVARTVDVLAAVESRFAREQVCVGVSGRARVGKSTLLQTVSGLTEEQIPTGPDVPVTAVRSRITHSPRRRAVLGTHTAASFLAEVIAPYHRELGIVGVPATLGQFRDWDYPRPSAEATDQHSSVGLHERLRRMQAALDSYAGLLTGGDLEVDVDRLRPYVAYPTNDEENAGVRDRRYLAVREARIECPFPNQEVDRLTLVDLPGLGELAAGAEARHVADLRHGIDVVLLVTAASADSTYFGTADQKALKLLDLARGDVRSPKDYVRIVLNTGKEPERVGVLRDRILADVNAGVDGQYYEVLEAALKDRRDVEEHVLLPLLSDLAGTLGRMDDDVLAAALDRAVATAEETGKALAALEGGSQDLAHNADELLARGSKDLRERVSFALRGLVSALQSQARDGGDDNDAYVDAVTDVFTGIRAWIEDGFGVGVEDWRSRALLEVGAEGNASPFIAEEMSRLRVEISKRFGGLDTYFDALLRQTWHQVADAFTDVLRPLMGAAEGEEALRLLKTLFDEASCPTLSDAVADLLGTRLEYRTHLHPRVRAALDGFNLEGVDPVTGEPMTRLVVGVGRDDVEVLESRLAELTEQAAYETMLALQRESVMPALVLHAAVEQFEDELIRSGRSKLEFARLARTHRNRLWPQEFTRIEGARTRAARVDQLIESISGALAGRRNP